MVRANIVITLIATFVMKVTLKLLQLLMVLKFMLSFMIIVLLATLIVPQFRIRLGTMSIKLRQSLLLNLMMLFAMSVKINIPHSAMSITFHGA